MTMHQSGALQLQVVADFVCPWCFIGKRSLDKAKELIARQGIDVDVQWLPYQLNPALPAEGMDRKTFRTMRFGSWENALAMDARAVEAGRRIGADFRYDRQNRTSNTLAAHGLARLALAEGGPALQNQVVDALFVAYFTNGQDIGDHTVLDRIAEEAGMQPGATRQSHAEILKLDEQARLMGLNGVPSHLVDGKLLFSGAQDVDGYVRSLVGAASRMN